MATIKPTVATSPTGLELSVSGVVSALKAVRKHWAIVVACVLVAGGSSLLYSKSQPKVYEAATLIEIASRASQPMGDSSNGNGVGLELGALLWDPQMYYQTQYKLIVSLPVMRAAADAVSLQADYDFFGLKAPPTPPITLDQAARALAGRVTVDPVKSSSLAYIRVSDHDPVRAKRLADAIAGAYVELNLRNAVDSSSEAVVWLDGQIGHLRGELEQSENALYSFKERNNLPTVSINDASNMLRLEMQDYNQALTQAHTRKEEFLARQAELARITAANPDEIPASELLANAYLQTLRAAYRTAVDKRESLLAQGKGENHPLVKEATDALEGAKRALLLEVANIQEGVARDLAVIDRQEQGESVLFNESRRRAVDLNMKEIEFHRLDRTREEDEKLYSLLLQRMKETDLARMMHSNNLRIVESAIVPGVPIRPRVGVNMAVGLVAGFLLGFGIAWLREQLDSSIKTPDDIERKLGLTFLGLLPVVEDGSASGQSRRQRRRRERTIGNGEVHGPAELVVHRRPTGGASEAARSIRTNLMFMNPDKPYRTMLVSSAAPAEGKTTVACSVAIAFAQGGQRVCIVDCDLRRPRLHRIFERQGDAGVTNVLVSQATIDEVAKPTGIDNLWCIPAGPLPPNPADILHSDRFRSFIRELGERFDRVVIDSPPLVAVTDSAIISTTTDAVIFVVRAFKTGKYLSAQGLRALRDVEAPVIGAVLNAVDLDHQEYSYYYYFYYKRDGYYRAQGDRTIDAGQSSASPPN